MLYRAELIVDGSVIAGETYPDHDKRLRVTHPQQAMRRIVEKYLRATRNVPDSQKPKFIGVNVMNEEGRVWHYSLTRKGSSQYEMTVNSKAESQVASGWVGDVMFGRKTIQGVTS